MTDITEALLAGRIAAQDALIGVLLALATSPATVGRETVWAMVTDLADDAAAGGRHAEAAYLRARANALAATP